MLRRSPSSLVRAVLLVVVSSAVLSCASSGGLVGRLKESSFPKAEELRALSKQPAAPRPEVFAGVADVETFALSAPLADTIGYEPATGQDPLLARLQAAVARKPGLVAVGEEMVCVARQIARFYGAEKKVPGDSLQSFILGRCGATVAQLRQATLGGDVPASTPDSEIVKEWSLQIDDMIRDSIGTGTRLLGAALVREGDQATLAIVSGERLAHVSQTPAVPVDGTFVLEGELLGQASRVDAAANRGAFESVRCEPKAGVELPAFHFTCTLDPTDEYAYVQVYAFPPGRILGRPVLTVMARPSGAVVDTYVRPKQLSATVSADAQNEPATVTKVLNEVRAAAHLAPLVVAPAQSVLATDLAPHYFGAGYGGTDESLADMIVLGLQAGWEVDALVNHGSFSSATVAGTVDLGRLVSNALELPGGRRTLLDPEAEHLAVGVMTLPEGSGLGGVFSTYRTLEPAAHAALADLVLESLNKARAEKGRPAAQVIGSLMGKASELANQMERGMIEPEDVSQHLMRAALAGKPGQSARSWMFSTANPRELEFPAELVDKRDLSVVPSVAIVRYPGQAWAAYLIVLVDAGGQEVEI